MLNKKGFSLIETVFAFVIVIVLGVGSLGIYNNYLANIDDSSILLESKINYTKELAKSAPSLTKYKIEGKNQYPYIQINNDSVDVFEKDDNGNFTKRNIKISVNRITPIKITTTSNILNKQLYFGSNGIPMQKVAENKYKRLINTNICISSKDRTDVININDKGSITLYKNKNIQECQK